MHSDNEEAQDYSVGQQCPLLAEFVNIHSRLIGFAAKELGYAYAEAEDIVQDAFVKVCSISDVSKIRNRSAYLHKIVKNLVNDYFGKKISLYISISKEDDRQLGFEDFVVDEILLKEILNSLSNEEKIVVLGRFRGKDNGEPYSYKDLGMIINKSPDAARMLFNRTMNKLVVQYRHNSMDCVGIGGGIATIEKKGVYECYDAAGRVGMKINGDSSCSQNPITNYEYDALSRADILHRYDAAGRIGMKIYDSYEGVGNRCRSHRYVRPMSLRYASKKGNLIFADRIKNTASLYDSSMRRLSINSFASISYWR